MMAENDCEIAALGGAASVEYLKSRLGELSKLGGGAKVVDMLGRFATQLEAFLAPDAAAPWPPADVHRITGLAAMLGFSKVAATWQVVETDAPKEADQAAARRAAEAAIHFARIWR